MPTDNAPTKTRWNWKEIAQKAWGKEYAKPDTVYQFSGGKEFKSTDTAESGIYKRT